LSHFERIKKQYGNAVEIIAISDENRDKVDAFIAKRNIHNVLFGMDWGINSTNSFSIILFRIRL
jgi:hypothetical protein